MCSSQMKAQELFGAATNCHLKLEKLDFELEKLEFELDHITIKNLVVHYFMSILRDESK